MAKRNFSRPLPKRYYMDVVEVFTNFLMQNGLLIDKDITQEYFYLYRTEKTVVNLKTKRTIETREILAKKKNITLIFEFALESLVSQVNLKAKEKVIIYSRFYSFSDNIANQIKIEELGYRGNIKWIF